MAIWLVLGKVYESTSATLKTPYVYFFLLTNCLVFGLVVLSFSNTSFASVEHSQLLPTNFDQDFLSY